MQTVEPFVGRRLEAEEDVEVLRDRAPGLEQLRVARDQIDTALHEDPPLPDAAAAQLLREREAARRVVPEQIVGDEDVVPRRGEVLAHRFDRTLSNRTRVQLPDRTERAAERTSARGLDQPRGPMGEARVLTPPRRDEMARRQRNLVELEGRRIRGRRDHLARLLPHRQARNLAQRPAGLDGVRYPRHRPLAVVENHGIDGIEQKGMRVGRRGVPADDDGHAWRELSNAPRQRHDVVGFERVHGGDADEARRTTRGAQLMFERAAESQIGERHRVAAGFERGRDVLHAERLDAEERTQPETLVPGHRTQQEYVHGSAVKRNIEAQRGASKRADRTDGL